MPAGLAFRSEDVRCLAQIGLPPALPRDDESTNIVAGIRTVFFPTFIGVTNATILDSA